jgi:hypothetical protein
MREIIDARNTNPRKYASESALQIEIVSHAMNLIGRYPEVALLHAIPNGDWRGPSVAQKLKAEGVKPGIPDLFLPVPRGGFHGFYIELKKGRGTVSPEQWSVMMELHAHGYFVRIFNDSARAISTIRDYLENNILRSKKS